jgi:hypothetical protein
MVEGEGGLVSQQTSQLTSETFTVLHMRCKSVARHAGQSMGILRPGCPRPTTTLAECTNVRGCGPSMGYRGCARQAINRQNLGLRKACADAGPHGMETVTNK